MSKHRHETIVATGAQDCWSLGVIAFEVLMERPAFEVPPGATDAVRIRLVLSLYQLWGR
jgi:hypothetical protein